MLLMRVFKFEASLFHSNKHFPPQPSCSQFRSRRRLTIVNIKNENFSQSNVKQAKLSARKKERIDLPSYSAVGGGKIYPIREFLCHPCGIEALLNTSALQSFEPLDASTYRCTLPQLNLLNFEVSPVMDLRVTPTNEDCLVELLSCKFEGSEIMERQNEHFSALMTNYITWNTKNSEAYLHVDVKLDLTLEIYTRPFTLLPTAAVETPGTLMMQALLDRLVPLLLQQLVRDYTKWVTETKNPQANPIPQNK